MESLLAFARKRSPINQDIKQVYEQIRRDPVSIGLQTLLIWE